MPVNRAEMDAEIILVKIAETWFHAAKVVSFSCRFQK